MPKPRVFVASSLQSLPAARAIGGCIENDANVTVWSEGVFSTSKTALQALFDRIVDTDFGVFVFSPEDVSALRDNKRQAVRDNVVFELGMFMGHLGQERCFIVAPRGHGKLKLPSDLLGLTVSTFPEPKTPERMIAALAPVCNRIRRSIARFGKRTQTDVKPAKRGRMPATPLATKALYELTFLSQRLSRLLLKQKEMSSSELMSHMRSVFLGHSQSIFEHIFPDGKVVVSLKTVDPRHPEQLQCHYAVERIPSLRRSISGSEGVPEYVPIHGSVSGRAFIERQTLFVADASQYADFASSEYLHKMKGLICSIVAWPILLDDRTVAVLKVDSPIVNLFDPNDETFVGVMRGLAAQFEFAFQVVSADRTKVEIAIDDSTATVSPQDEQRILQQIREAARTSDD
jgi:hypothetical protein